MPNRRTDPDPDMSEREPAPDPIHDPGPAVARQRADALPLRPATVVHPAGAGTIRVGTAGWTDRSLTAAGVFYPPSARTPATRLGYYASRFPIVEVDATYYALPTQQMTAAWVMRTPETFTFNVKAFALMTGHAADVRRLPRALRAALPDDLATKSRLYGNDLPTELEEAIWREFTYALEPLHAAGKLGAILLQYPPWFGPSAAHRDLLVAAKQRLSRFDVAVEFRNGMWFEGATSERTLHFLRDHDLAFVMVDEPQGFESSVPPIAAVTSSRLAVLRLHGRRQEGWEKKGATVDERFRYLYTPEELGSWVPKLLDAAHAARDVHVIYNNSHANYATTNALECTELLLAAIARPPEHTRPATDPNA